MERQSRRPHLLLEERRVDLGVVEAGGAVQHVRDGGFAGPVRLRRELAGAEQDLAEKKPTKVQQHCR